MRVGSLFSGIGGFDLGLERAGMEIAWQAELDPYCSRVLAAHWPEVKNYGDVARVGLHIAGDVWEDGRQRPVECVQPVDLICGGFPCQDVSVAGKRAGLDGARSGLWLEYKRILSELRPAWAIIENVPGLLSSNQGRDFGVILDGLGECGFGGIAWAVLDSQHFGVAQRRRRVFIVCGPSSRSVEQVLSLCEGCGGDTAPGRAAGEDVAATIRGRSSGPGVNEPGRGGEDDSNLVLSPTLLGGDQPRGWRTDADYGLTVVGAISSKWARGTGGPSGDEVQNLVTVAHSLRADGFDASEDGIGITENAETMYTLVGTCQHAIAGALKGSRGEMRDSSAEAADRLVYGASVRRLTPVECARLQGFPDDWLAEGADGPKYKALGNAVSVPVIEYSGRRILAVRP